MTASNALGTIVEKKKTPKSDLLRLPFLVLYEHNVMIPNIGLLR